MTTRLGLTLPLDGLPVSQTTLPLARLAEDLGYTDIWSAEVGGTDGLTPLAAIATGTQKIRLGTAILPVFTRSPALIAMGAASVQALSGGRFVLGIGTSSSIIVGNWMGVPFERPYTRVKETLQILRDALGGKKLSFSGETVSSQGFRLTADPEKPVPIYVAALGPRMLRLAGEEADGVILYLFTPDGARKAVEQVRAAAKAAGRDPDSIEVVARIAVAVGQDPEVLGFMLRRLTVGYAMVDVYNRSLSRQGFESEAAEITKRWQDGDRDGAAAAISERMLDELYVIGDRDECAAKLKLFRDAGIKTPVLFPVSVAGDPADRLAQSTSMIEVLAGA